MLTDAWHRTNVVHVMIAALVVITGYNLYIFGIGNLFQIIAIVATAVLLDLAINYLKEKRLFLPKNAVISGLILGVVIQGSILFLVLVAAVAILSKHIIKIKGKHIFNPANFGLFLALVLFPVSQSWWGASNLLLVAILGLIIVWKLKRYHLALPFLAAHAVLMFIIFSFSVNQLAAHFASGSLLFFTFYMLIEPITSPVRIKSRIIFGIFAGVFASVLYLVWLPAMLVGALLFADLFVPLLNRQREKPAMQKPEQLRSEPLTNPNW